MMGLDADASCEGLMEKRTEAEGELSSEQIDGVMNTLYGAGRSGLSQNGDVSADSARQPAVVVDVSLTFPQVNFLTSLPRLPHTAPLGRWHTSAHLQSPPCICEMGRKLGLAS